MSDKILTSHDEVVSRIVQALGLDPNLVRSLDIHFRVGCAVTVNVERFVTDVQGEKTGEVIYELGEIRIDETALPASGFTTDITALGSLANERVSTAQKAHWPGKPPK